jgi:SAM-dependent methyltransferase
MKAFVKRLAHSAGYEIRKVQPCLNVEGDPPLEDRVANRNHRPRVLQYRRTQYGDDQRLKYMIYFLDLRDLRVLELGPWMGHHSITLEKMGVRENTAVESRVENLKLCQHTKEVFGLDRTTFVLGNLEDFYNGTKQPPFSTNFDLIFCVGILYHVPDPGKALARFRAQGKALFLGTHVPEQNQPLQDYRYNGKFYRAFEFREDGIHNPLSGMSPTSLWPCEGDLTRLLRDVGYQQVSVLGRDLQNRIRHVTILAE